MPKGRPKRVIDNRQHASELRAISKRIRTKQDQLRELEEERNQLVLQAVAEGWTHAQIADETGLTRSRVGQIALG